MVFIIIIIIIIINWKAPGRDQIANFWLKQLTATHKHIAALFNKLIEDDQIPEFFFYQYGFLGYW